jgi:sulfatase maturation enzyme AslB (radical SAM superfamily)
VYETKTRRLQEKAGGTIRMTRFKVVSVHFTKACNLKCGFCYRGEQDTTGERPRQFFLDLIPYIAKLAPQVALGGGSPLIDVPFVKQFAHECKAYNLICNITTNGRKLLEMSDDEVKDVLKDVTMLSVSFDSYKWPKPQQYMELIHRLKRLTNIQIGANMLLELPMFADGTGLGMAKTVQWLFEKAKIDRVFALYPKNMDFNVDITKEDIKSFYQALTMKYKRFYVDDVSKMILSEGYDNWKTPCHRGKDIISIDEKGGVSMCSFDKPIIILDKPKYLIDIVEAIKVCGFDSCPFVRKPSGLIKLGGEQ